MPDSVLRGLTTEQINQRTEDLDRLDPLGILKLINDEDRTIAAAVRNANPSIAAAVDIAAQRWRQGGRIVLFGAGTSGRLAALDAAELPPTFGIPGERYQARRDLRMTRAPARRPLQI